MFVRIFICSPNKCLGIVDLSHLKALICDSHFTSRVITNKFISTGVTVDNYNFILLFDGSEEKKWVDKCLLNWSDMKNTVQHYQYSWSTLVIGKTYQIETKIIWLQEKWVKQLNAQKHEKIFHQDRKKWWNNCSDCSCWLRTENKSSYF